MDNARKAAITDRPSHNGTPFADSYGERHEMSGENTIVFVYAIPTAVIRALRRLNNSGSEIKFSVVAKGYEDANQGENRSNEFWQRLWSSVPGQTSFAIPEIGQVLIAGPMSDLMVSVLDNASMFDGLNPLEACLHSIGIPSEKISACTAAVQAGGILLLIHGPVQEVSRAGEILSSVWAEHAGKRN